MLWPFHITVEDPRGMTKVFVFHEIPTKDFRWDEVTVITERGMDKSIPRHRQSLVKPQAMKPRTSET
jgi:hypothetical protein